MHLTEQLRQSMIGDMSALHENLDRVWKIVQSLPAGGTRDDLENAHQRMAQLVLNTKKSFLSPLPPSPPRGCRSFIIPRSAACRTPGNVLATSIIDVSSKAERKP